MPRCRKPCADVHGSVGNGVGSGGGGRVTGGGGSGGIAGKPGPVDGGGGGGGGGGGVGASAGRGAEGESVPGACGVALGARSFGGLRDRPGSVARGVAARGLTAACERRALLRVESLPPPARRGRKLRATRCPGNTAASPGRSVTAERLAPPSLSNLFEVMYQSPAIATGRRIRATTGAARESRPSTRAAEVGGPLISQREPCVTRAGNHFIE